MEFRLVYRGKLPAQSSGKGSRVPIKHDIRRQLHPQLKALWRDHPGLRGWAEADEKGDSGLDHWANKFERCGGKRFLPLVAELGGIACHLDILFLRRDQPGGLVASGGDLDNRIKTLLDALQVPKTCDQLPSSWIPAEDEDPLYCLMEDDSLITTLSITTDRLLEPQSETEGNNNVFLVIHVKTVIVNNLSSFSIGGAPCL